MDEISKKTDPPIDPLEINSGASRDGISDDSSDSDPPERDAADLVNETYRNNPVTVHHLDGAKPLDPSTYPNQGPGDNGTKLPATIPNLMHLLVRLRHQRHDTTSSARSSKSAFPVLPAARTMLTTARWRKSPALPP